MGHLKPFNFFDEFCNGILHFFICFWKTKLRWSIVIFVGLFFILIPISIKFHTFPPVEQHSQINCCHLVLFDKFFHFSIWEQGTFGLKNENKFGENSNKFLNICFDSVFAANPKGETMLNPNSNKSTTNSEQINIGFRNGDSENIHFSMSLEDFYFSLMVIPIWVIAIFW